MEKLPILLPASFILTTLLTLVLLLRSTGSKKRLLIISAGWLILQGIITYAGFI